MFASKRSRSLVVSAAAVVAPLVIAACSADLGPGPMPTGYAHQNEVYKAQPGPRPVLMKDHMLKNQDREVERYHPNGGGDEPATAGDMPAPTSWDDAAADLVNKMLTELGRPMENVYVTPGTSADLEHALNRAMDARGIKVAEAPGEGPFTVRYFMTPVSDSPMVSITLMSVGAAVHEVSGLYNIAAASATGSATPAGGDEPMPILPAPGAAR